MKNIFLALTLVPSLSFACADFTGEYSDGNADMTITQSGCESFSIQYEDRKEDYTLDRVMKEIYRNESMIVSASAYIVPSSPIIRMTIETKKFAGGSTEKKFRRLALFQRKVLLDQIAKYRTDDWFKPEFQTKWTKKTK